MSESQAALLGLGCAAPAGEITQEQALALSMEISPPRDEDDRRRTEAIYLKCGVRTRGTAPSPKQADGVGETLGLFRPAAAVKDLGPSTSHRMRAYIDRAEPLAEASSLAALKDANVGADAITHLVTATCTGFSAPGWDVGLIRRLGLRSSTLRTHLGFMGCHAAINALRVAQAFAMVDPRARVLVSCTEICSVHFQYAARPDQIVANALFADGSASAIVARSGSGFAHLGASASCVLPDSADQMGWTIGDHGFVMNLSSAIPTTIRAHCRPWLDDWLGQAGLSRAAVRSWAVHPGGPRVLSSFAEAAELPGDAILASRDILAAHGNMSSPTVLFILDQLRRKPNGLARPTALISFGPGVTAEGMLLA